MTLNKFFLILSNFEIVFTFTLQIFLKNSSYSVLAIRFLYGEVFEKFLMSRKIFDGKKEWYHFFGKRIKMTFQVVFYLESQE